MWCCDVCVSCWREKKRIVMLRRRVCVVMWMRIRIIMVLSMEMTRWTSLES